MTHDDFLHNIMINKINISVYLINGVMIRGYLKYYDKESIIIKDDVKKTENLFYKHAIASICPYLP